MQCIECGIKMTEINGVFEWNAPFIGTIRIDNSNYLKCDKCGETAIGDELWDKIDDAEKNTLTELLNKKPFGDFITANETAEYLNITKQALSKSAHIYNFKIFNLKKGGRYFFLKNSVEKFKETKGDGRFNLAEPAVKCIDQKLTYTPSEDITETMNIIQFSPYRQTKHN